MLFITFNQQTPHKEDHRSLIDGFSDQHPQIRKGWKIMGKTKRVQEKHVSYIPFGFSPLHTKTCVGMDHGWSVVHHNHPPVHDMS